MPTHVQRVEKFASRSRAYICISRNVWTSTSTSVNPKQHIMPDQNTYDTTPSVIKQELLFQEIERLLKDFKCNRAVIDFDSAFINAELRYGSMHRLRVSDSDRVNQMNS